MISGRPPRFAIFGPAGIGAVHARVVNLLGGEVLAVVGRSIESTTAAADHLYKLHGFRPFPYVCLDTLIREQSLDAVIIATPPEIHYEQLLRLSREDVVVYCEKPLVGRALFSANELELQMNILRQQGAMPHFLGLSNSYLATALMGRFPKKISRVEFSFHTNGRHRFEDIAWDLLPHGFSILEGMGIVGHVFSAQQKITSNSWGGYFQKGDVTIEFDFRQGLEIPKKLVITVNGVYVFERVQQGQGDTYRIFIREGDDNLIEIEDPFVSAMKDFFCLLRGGKVAGPCFNPEVNMYQVMNFAVDVGLLS